MFLEHRARYIALITGIVLCFYCCCIHEPWSDEAQSWLIANELSPLEMFSNIHYEGHPILYHLIIKPFTYILPFSLSQFTSFLFVSVALMLFYKTDMDNNLFILLATSPICFYYIGAFARSYSLAWIFIALTVYLYPRRKELKLMFALVVALGMSIHFMVTPYFAVLGLWFGIEELSVLIGRARKSGGVCALQKSKDILLCGLILLLGVWFCFNQFVRVDLTAGAGNNMTFEGGDVAKTLATACAFMLVPSLPPSVVIGFILLIFYVAVFLHSWRRAILGICMTIPCLVIMIRSMLPMPAKTWTYMLVVYATLMILGLSYVSDDKKAEVSKNNKVAIWVLCFQLCCVSLAWKTVIRDTVEDYSNLDGLISVIEEQVPAGSKILVASTSIPTDALITLRELGYDAIVATNDNPEHHFTEWTSHITDIANEVSMDAAITLMVDNCLTDGEIGYVFAATDIAMPHDLEADMIANCYFDYTNTHKSSYSEFVYGIRKVTKED